jgi:hypothetical protein
VKLRKLCSAYGFLLIALVLLPILVVVGCDALPTENRSVTETSVGSSPTGPSASSTDAPSSSATTSSLETPTTEALSSAETLLPDGHIKAMGFIDDVWEDGSGRHLRIDYAEMLTDAAECTEAARRDGKIGPTETWDLDFYISNVNPMLRTFDVSNSVAITTSTRWVSGESMEMGAPCTWADFLSFWGPGPYPGPYPESETHLYAMPWWIERDGTVVVKIDEQYLP